MRGTHYCLSPGTVAVTALLSVSVFSCSFDLLLIPTILREVTLLSFCINEIRPLKFEDWVSSWPLRITRCKTRNLIPQRGHWSTGQMKPALCTRAWERPRDEVVCDTGSQEAFWMSWGQKIAKQDGYNRREEWGLQLGGAAEVNSKEKQNKHGKLRGRR